MENKYLRITLFVFFLCCIFAYARANNMQLLGRAKLVDKDKTTGKVNITFQLQWENSWRTSTPNNWDAAWVFVKFKHDETTWLHAYIDTNASAHSAIATVPVEFSVGKSQVKIGGQIVTKGVGVFIYRKEQGHGSISFSNISLAWQYLQQLEENNVEYIDGPIALRVYALEMVYVPKGPFHFGHMGTVGSNLSIHPTLGFIYPHAYSINYDNSNAPYQGVMPLVYLSDTNAAVLESAKWTSSPTYPNGNEAFYMMKYELSQHAYSDFLNTLTYEQQMQRSGAALPNLTNYTRFYIGNRNMLTIRLPGAPAFELNKSVPGIYGCRYGNEALLDWDVEYNGGNIAMSNLSWADCAAYLAWAALRPLTEMEYEKSCRGIYLPIKNEYAWGNAEKVDNNTAAPLNAYKLNELPALTSANFIPQTGNLTNGNTLCFPMRVGCFAKSNTTRDQAGAAYYGAMNMSDNVSELYVNCNTREGLAFNGSHGYGVLDPVTALPSVETWPNLSTALGLGVKGVYGVPTATANTAFVSDRGNMNLPTVLNNIKNRYHLLGCRGGRSASQ